MGVRRQSMKSVAKAADAGSTACDALCRGAMSEPSPRKLAGIAIILAIIVIWAIFVASLAPFVGKWPVLVQAPYYLFVGVAWIIPLKPLIRWIQTGSFRVRH